MSVRLRVITVLGLACLAMAASVVVLVRAVVLPAFDHLDAERQAASLAALRGSVQREADHLRTKLLDYSQWDEAYRWLNERTGDFPQRKFTLVQLVGIQQLAFFGSDGQCAGGVACDPAGQHLAPLAGVADLSSGPVRQVLADGAVRISPLLLDGRAALVGAAPVLRSNATGPPAGCLVVLIWVDPTWVARLAETMQAPLRLEPTPGTRPAAEGVVALDDARSECWLTGSDPTGVPVYTLAKALPRDLHALGRSTMWILALGAVGILVAAVVACALALDRIVLARLVRLRVAVAGMEQDLAPPPGGDEIDDLGHVVRQATARMRGELDERAKVEARLREAIRQREELTRLVVHDMRSPLQGIIGAIDLIHRRGGIGTERDLALSLEAAQSLAGMVDELLEIEKLESGHMELRCTTVSVTDLVWTARQRLGTVLARHEVVTSIPQDLPSPHCDRALVERAIQNLLGNAAKFSPPGSRIDITAASVADQVRLTVTDQGPGIPADHLPYLFEKFSRLASTHDRRNSTGLGLSQVRLTVEAHGGSVTAASTVGQGTAITMTLPLQPAPARRVS